MIRCTLIILIALAVPLSPKGSAQQAKKENPPTQSAAVEKDTNLVVARVSGRPVTEEQLLWVIERLAIQKRLPMEQREKRHSLLFKEALDSSITLMLLRNQAQQENVVIDKATIDAEVQKYKRNFPTEEDFLKTLKRQGITETEFRESLEETMTVSEMINRAVKDTPAATEEEIKAFYDENQNRFPVPAQVRASQILIRVDPESTPEQKAEAIKKLESIRADIESQKIAFADAASKYSQDRVNTQEGGDLGFFTRGQKPKPIEDSAFALNPGDMSQILETREGYHLLQVTESKPARMATLEEVRGIITTMLNREAQRRIRDEYIDRLISKATIETFMTQEEFAERHAPN